MNTVDRLKELGFSQYEVSCYLALVANHPVNGSQLSKLSGISRSRIYDVLRNMRKKGLVQEVENGHYVPLPPDEFVKRLRSQFEGNIASLEHQLKEASEGQGYEYVWTIIGYNEVMDRAIDMINSAKKELYVRLFPEGGKILDPYLHQASIHGVEVRYIAMGNVPLTFDVQVIHPESEKLIFTMGGRSLDVIADKSEALVGIFEKGKEDQSPINWTRNQWFVIANRDSLRHDFYHYFLDKIYDRTLPLTEQEEKIYQLIKSDD